MSEQTQGTRGQRLILNNGAVIEDGRAGCSQGTLVCFVTGFTMQQAADLFFDPGKTSKIIFQYGEMADEFKGFTNCININNNADGVISVCLTKGA